MGAYLSEPVTNTVTEEGDSQKLEYGASSMQGWRVSQEDAHCAIIDYDESTELFAVYDGHGGAEVAQYSAQHLHKVIKSMPAYKAGDYEKALEDAFLEFDKSLTQKDVVEQLKILAGTDDLDDDDDDDDDDDEDEAHLLREEANLPIEEVMSRYNSVGNKAEKKNQNENEMSPCSSSKAAKSSLPIHIRREIENKSKKLISPFLKARQPKSSIDEENPDSSPSASTNVPNDSKEASSSNGEIKDVSNQPDSTNDSEVSSALNENKDEKKDEQITANSSTDCQSTSSYVEKPKSPIEKTDDSVGSSSSSIKEQEATPTSTKGKGKQKKIVEPKRKRIPIEENEVPVYQSFLDDFTQDSDESEDDSSDEFKGSFDNSDEDEDLDDEEDEESEEDESDEDDDDEDERNMIFGPTYEEPGRDSGCTAVVALIKGNCLYVANTGDSRCVVSRDGKAVEMSFDHKPEDQIERERIEKAGGHVTSDGRVNNGLNLSRAIGDHSYKDNPNISAREQMITALPDVKKLTLQPESDQFMVLACDGIWNSMTSQQVIDFVEERLKANETLTSICDGLFRNCLAPDTMGDGTGCDNMTCIIVKFKDISSPNELIGKRKLSDSEAQSISDSAQGDVEIENPSKKLKACSTDLEEKVESTNGSTAVN